MLSTLSYIQGLLFHYYGENFWLFCQSTHEITIKSLHMVLPQSSKHHTWKSRDSQPGSLTLPMCTVATISIRMPWICVQAHLQVTLFQTTNKRHSRNWRSSFTMLVISKTSLSLSQPLGLTGEMGEESEFSSFTPIFFLPIFPQEQKI